MATLNCAEYIWLDGAVPVRELRSKTRVLSLPESPVITDFPEWGYDGSSTAQSEGGNSDLALKPVNFVKDPLRGDGNFLVMCEVFNQDGAPHASNSRAALREVLEAGAAETDPWVGFEQEYTFFKDGRPLGWPTTGFPAPQGPYYCGVGPQNVFGRELVEAHLKACLDAGICIYGVNAEVMPGQWEFQVGYRGVEGEDAGMLNISDHLWIARWLMHRLGEEFGIQTSFENKPVEGDWNGAGCHTNFSTKAMRAEGGIEAIHSAIARLETKHNEHIEVYGHNLAARLTGLHETCSISEFKAGASDRGCSIRIPLQVEQSGKGYLEDRRPGANCDPYLVSARLLNTICDLDMSSFGDWSLDAILTAGK